MGYQDLFKNIESQQLQVEDAMIDGTSLLYRNIWAYVRNFTSFIGQTRSHRIGQM